MKQMNLDEPWHLWNRTFKIKIGDFETNGIFGYFYFEQRKVVRSTITE